MGIGNFGLVGGIFRDGLTSLPLMGIGNSKVSGSSARSWARFSLPLMGIGNPSQTTTYRLTVENELITPHGDRKPIRTDKEALRTAQTHYPSWGSETVLDFVTLFEQAELITPHGDRKP